MSAHARVRSRACALPRSYRTTGVELAVDLLYGNFIENKTVPDPFNFADSLLAVLAQRLVRRLCTECRTSEVADDAFVDELLDDYLHSYPAELRPDRKAVHEEWLAGFGHAGHLTRYRAPGCSHCQNTGLHGRVGMHELLLVTPGLRHLIQTGGRPEQLQFEGMQNGFMRTLRQDGILKVLGGQSTIEEVRANSNI